MGAYSRLGAYSNKYSISWSQGFLDQLDVGHRK